MSLTRLSLTDFRSYAEAAMSPGAGFVVLTGQNGAGKTNVLEAVSLLAPGRGLRRAALSEMVRSGGGGGFAVNAVVDDQNLGTGVAANSPERRVVRINGAGAAATALSDHLSIVWLTPAMDRLFMEGASERRRFLDRLVLALDPAHARHTTRYEAALRQRNRLLADERAPDTAWLTALEAQLAEHGAGVAAARLDLVARLNEVLSGLPAHPFARAALAIGGWTGGDLAAQMVAGRGRDRAAGRTLDGPHRSDLDVTHLDKGQPAARGSTGEQKALLLGVILAHAELVAARSGRRPVLLLDEVAAHLDPVRREALFGRLDGNGQVWMTGTEAAPFEAIKGAASRFHVESGRILPG